MKKYILGISALYHNSAAALISRNGAIVFAAEEERFTRKKGDASFPINAIKFCLDSAKIQPEHLYAISYYENPSYRFGRIITNSFLNIPKSFLQFTESIPDWISNKLWIEKTIQRELEFKGNITFVSHHLSHAASAFYPSPFKESAILTIDGTGEWSTMAWGIGEGNKITMKETIRFPNSLGLLYSAFTYYTGFKINNGEYKMMGLAPYGKPVYSELIKKELINIANDGSFSINQKYFSYTYGMKTINCKFEKLFGEKARTKDKPISIFYADVAASIQQVTNEVILSMANSIRQKSGKNNLVMAGGVALNITSNSNILKSNIFDDIWIQPAAGDAGGAIGAALETCYRMSNTTRKIVQAEDAMNDSFLGYSIEDSFTDDVILKSFGSIWINLNEQELSRKVAKLLSEGKIVGIAKGRAEFGPRALGNRSILADARDPEMLQRLNKKIKFREGFRPFAPAVIEEDVSDYFETSMKSPYMLFTFPVKECRRKPIQKSASIEATASLSRSDIPAVTHIDYSARIQTVGEKSNPFLYAILSEFKKITGYSVLINTSFNTNNEPIVNTSIDAYKCFMRSQIDYAVIGNRLFDKKKQPETVPSKRR